MGTVLMMVPGSIIYKRACSFSASRQDMFRRRGGWRYAVTEVRLQTLFYKMGFSGFFSLLKKVCIRLVIPSSP